jgi:hypothetical protein
MVMNTEHKEKILSFFDTLTDSLGESEGMSREDIIADLKEEGIEVDASIKRIQMMVEQASLKARRQQLDIAREKRLALETERPARLASFLNWTKDWTKEQIIEKICELAHSKTLQPTVSYRELQSKNLEDLAALYDDLINTKEMEEPEP